MEYKLEAKLNDKVSSRRLVCYNNEEAVTEAAFLVMDLAQQHPKSAWALGAITLSNAEGMIERMGSKLV
jgi:hypothetical protein